MKKLAAAMLIAALAVGCVACGSKEDTSANNASTDAAAEETGDSAEASDSKSYSPTDIEYHSELYRSIPEQQYIRMSLFSALSSARLSTALHLQGTSS